MTLRPDRILRILRRAKEAAAAAALCALASAAGGCFVTGSVNPDLRSVDPAEKIPGMKAAATRRDPAALPDLVAALDNEDVGVRFFASEAMRQYTDQTFGYHYFDDREERAPAMKLWKEWLKGQPTGGRP